MRKSFRFLLISSFLATSAAVAAAPVARRAPASGPPELAEQFVQACNSQLALSDAQRTGLREYLEQEINYMAVQVANHTPAEVAELVPAEREELQRVAGHLMSPGQLRQFRELEATPQMREYLKQMSLAD